jgi:hypothetical protein
MKLLILMTYLFMASAWAKPCGLEGTMEDRIKDCNLIKENFVLIARDDKGLEVYKDTKTEMIWGDRIISDFNHYGSQRACTDDLREAQLFKDLKWRLPTVREFEVAASHGMKTAVVHMEHFFWTSTPVKTKRARRRRAPPAQVFLWDGTEQKTDVGDIKDAASVRCVAR